MSKIRKLEGRLLNATRVHFEEAIRGLEERLSDRLATRLLHVEERLLTLMASARALGVENLAWREKTEGSGSTVHIGRNTVPEEVLQRATTEIVILALSAKGTICREDDLIGRLLAANSRLRLGCAILTPTCPALSVELSSLSTLGKDISATAEKLQGLSDRFPGRVELHYMNRIPTFFATAVDAGILGEPGPNGLIGVQPYVEGSNVHFGLIVEISPRSPGPWGTFSNGIAHYWKSTGTNQLTPPESAEHLGIPRRP